jgi:hypothetical protein
MINLKKFESNSKKNNFNIEIYKSAQKYSLRKTDAFIKWWNNSNAKCHGILSHENADIALKLTQLWPHGKLIHSLKHDITHKFDEFTTRQTRTLPCLMMLEYLPIECVWNETFGLNKRQKQNFTDKCNKLKVTLELTSSNSHLIGGDVYDSNHLVCGTITEVTPVDSNILILVTGIGLLCGLPPFSGKLIYNTKEENILNNSVTLTLNFSESSKIDFFNGLKMYIEKLTCAYVFVKISDYNEELICILMNQFSFIPLFNRRSTQTSLVMADADLVVAIPKFKDIMFFRPIC